MQDHAEELNATFEKERAERERTTFTLSARPRPRTSMLAAAALMAAIAGAGPMQSGRRVRTTPRRGNKYRLCECGSHVPYANCCGKSRLKD